MTADHHHHQSRKIGGGAPFSWTSRNEQSWDFIIRDDDDDGSFSIDRRFLNARFSEATIADAPVRRGILRHLLLILDFGESAADPDMPPSRARCMASTAVQFMIECSRQNPLCQIGVLVMRDGLVERRLGLTTMNTDSSTKTPTLLPEWLKDVEARGETSLQNALSVAHGLLLHVPAHGTREVIILQSSLSSCDPSDIFGTIEQLRRDRIRVSIVSVSAQVRVSERIAKETGGTYAVALDPDHFKALLFEEHIRPPPITSTTGSSGQAAPPTSYLVPMGFPKSLGLRDHNLCACHARVHEAGGFECPQCKGKVCQIPIDCPQCGLTLISAPHLARTYHHLFPLGPFSEESPSSSSECVGCASKLVDSSAYVCQSCHSPFCYECNLFIHQTLHTCPQCI